MAIKRAINEAFRIAEQYNPKHSQINGYRHYSFVVQDSKILDWDTNSDGPPLAGYKTYQKQHAENGAYFKSKHILDIRRPFDLINIRLSRAGHPRASCPCECCSAWLKKVGCRSVYFSVKNTYKLARIYL